MARRKGANGVNKAALIRDFIAQGLTSAKDIETKMTGLGHKVSMPSIYTALSSARKGRSPAQPKRASATTAAPKAAPSNGSHSLNVEDLTALATLTKKAGGVASVKALLDAMSLLSA
jgi:hypothetical protein